VTLDDLRVKAQAASDCVENTGWWNKTVLYNLLGGKNDECPPEDAAYIAAADPQTVLKLIAAVEAAKMVLLDLDGPGETTYETEAALRSALKELE
jgi:hypothetical protein